MENEEFVCICHRPSTDTWLQLEVPDNLVRQMDVEKIIDYIRELLGNRFILKDMQLGYEEVS